MINLNRIRSSKSTSATCSAISHTLLTGLVIGCLLSMTVSPIYAWWFDSSKPTHSITPTHQSGLTLSPFIKSVVPQFILEPLTTETVELPPSVEATPVQKNNSLVITPIESAARAQASISSVSSNRSTAEQMLLAVNAERAKHGLVALTLNTQLSNSAQAYALKMQQTGLFQHKESDGTTLKERNEAAGYTNWKIMGENLGKGQASVTEVVREWMESPEHRANILKPEYRELGVGHAPGVTQYWVQEFGAQF